MTTQVRWLITGERDWRDLDEVARRSGKFAGWIAFWSGKRDRSGTLDCMSQIASLGVPGQVIAKQMRGRGVLTG